MAKEVFRVVNIADGQEVERFIDLVGACVRWVKNPRNLRVEAVLVGGNTPTRVVPNTECCTALRAWFPQNKNFVSKDERDDMQRFIDDACQQR